MRSINPPAIIRCLKKNEKIMTLKELAVMTNIPVNVMATTLSRMSSIGNKNRTLKSTRDFNGKHYRVNYYGLKEWFIKDEIVKRYISKAKHNESN